MVNVKYTYVLSLQLQQHYCASLNTVVLLVYSLRTDTGVVVWLLSISVIAGTFIAASRVDTLVSTRVMSRLASITFVHVDTRACITSQ